MNNLDIFFLKRFLETHYENGGPYNQNARISPLCWKDLGRGWGRTEGKKEEERENLCIKSRRCHSSQALLFDLTEGEASHSLGNRER